MRRTLALAVVALATLGFVAPVSADCVGHTASSQQTTTASDQSTPPVQETLLPKQGG